MCRVMEEKWEEGRKSNQLETAKRMLADGILSLEKIAQYLDLSLDEVKRLRAAMPQ